MFLLNNTTSKLFLNVRSIFFSATTSGVALIRSVAIELYSFTGTYSFIVLYVSTKLFFSSLFAPNNMKKQLFQI